MKDKQTKLVPKLRFPEFRGEAGWEEHQLSDITTAIFDGTHQTPTYTPEGVPFYSVENLVSGNANKFISRADYDLATKKNKPERGDVLITRIGKIGYSQVVTWSHDFSIYVTLAVIKKDARFNSDFLNQFMQSGLYQKEILSKSLLNAVPCKINMDSLRATRVLLTCPAEQQKIADCLSSLDELIAAQARKVDALKTHKKGLMQQLFPREGETQPRLRFPEFRGAGEWVDYELGLKVSKIGSGITPTGGDKNYKLSGRVFVRSQNVGWGVLLLDDVAYIDEQTHASFDSTEIKPRDVLLNITGASIGRSAVADQRIVGGNVNQHVCIIRTKPNELDSLLLNQFLISERGQRQIDSFQAGGNRQGLNFAQIRSFVVPLPPSFSEQQRIADCLSSLDTLITTATRELETLKTHKKGLMQQLFPSTEVVEA